MAGAGAWAPSSYAAALLNFRQMDEEHSSDAYRRNAETCRRLADTTQDVAQKANWLMLAAEWKRLAEATEKIPPKER